MKNFGIKEAGVRKVREIFCCVSTLQELVEKKTIFGAEKNSEKCTILFFLREHLACHLIKKIASALRTQASLMPKKFILFKFFLLFFLIYCSQRIDLHFFLSHEFLECPNSLKICTHLAPLSIFEPTKFQIFLIFLLFFQI